MHIKNELNIVKLRGATKTELYNLLTSAIFSANQTIIILNGIEKAGALIYADALININPAIKKISFCYMERFGRTRKQKRAFWVFKPASEFFKIYINAKNTLLDAPAINQIEDMLPAFNCLCKESVVGLAGWSEVLDNIDWPFTFDWQTRLNIIEKGKVIV